MAIKPIVLHLIVLCSLSVAQARVFKFQDEHIASYLRGTFGLSTIGDSSYKLTSGTDTQYDKSIDFNTSAEIGFLYHFNKVAFKVGVLYLFPERLSDIKGSNTSGTDLFNLEVDISALVPMLAIEFDMSRTDTFRTFLSLGGGYGFVSAKNIYTMTAAGTSAFGVTDYEEKFDDEAFLYTGALGMEYLLADTVTMNLEAGYRYLVANELEHKANAETIAGPVGQGEKVVNPDGSGRVLDFSGAYVAIGFRFYIEIPR